MKSGRRSSWDIRLGLMASGVAIAGLLASLASGNTKVAVVGENAAQEQTLLLFFATASLGLVAAKMVLRSRRSKSR